MWNQLDNNEKLNFLLMVDIDVHVNDFYIGQYWNQWEWMDVNDE
jgi:hypothetical protein